MTDSVHKAAPILEQGSQLGRREGGDAAPLAEGSDRDLLEKAAEAAGFDHISVHADGATYAHDGICNPTRWDPLTDDGDALRLAVAIPACIVIDNDMQWCGVHLNGSRGKYDLVEQFNGDKAAATRRAIVRAAAAMASGK
jgi:hypothetical protein